MQLINAPAKLVLPFANAGAKNTIPTASQIGIVAGAASLTDGFPPLTRTPLAAGGVPPSGLDMNGILFELSAILRWANAGGGYPYDSTFANDTNVQGYPKGARVLRSDGTGYWFNTTDGNTTDPEGAGAVAAGWVPDFTTGAAAVTMTSANVTLTAAQYGKPIIVITGLLTANLNLIFPNIVGEWIVINSTTGPYTITCKTAAGTGVVVNSVQALVGDATNIYSAVNDAISSMGELVAVATGTSDALIAAFNPSPRSWANGVPFFVRAASANATTTPTITFNNGVLATKTIAKGSNSALIAGDIAGPGHWLAMQYDATLDKVILLNPATGVVAAPTVPAGSVVYTAQNSAPNGFLKANGAAVSRTTYSALFAALVKSATVTITIATPGVITWNSHGLSANDPVQFTTTGALPTGLTAGTVYYVVGASITTNTFQLSTTPGGSALATSGTQSGVHTGINAPWGVGDGSTTFNVPDLRGEFLRGWDDSRGVDSARAFGSYQIGSLTGGYPNGGGNSFGMGTLNTTTAKNPVNGWDLAVVAEFPTAYFSGASGAVTSVSGQTVLDNYFGVTRPRNKAVLACVKY